LKRYKEKQGIFYKDDSGKVVAKLLETLQVLFAKERDVRILLKVKLESQKIFHKGRGIFVSVSEVSIYLLTLTQPEITVMV